MVGNTLRTIVGFFRSIIDSRTPFGRKQKSIQGICNYLLIDNLYATSGQPSEVELGLIGEAGYQTVINLTPQSLLENSVANEAEILQRLGVTYIHIPVDFKSPTDQDFETFVDSLQEQSGRKLWVHCAANMRVSAFTYRYRTHVLGDDPETADPDLRKIWNPFGVWKEFIKGAAGDA